MPNTIWADKSCWKEVAVRYKTAATTLATALKIITLRRPKRLDKGAEGIMSSMARIPGAATRIPTWASASPNTLVPKVGITNIPMLIVKANRPAVNEHIQTLRFNPILLSIPPSSYRTRTPKRIPVACKRIHKDSPTAVESLLLMPANSKKGSRSHGTPVSI